MKLLKIALYLFVLTNLAACGDLKLDEDLFGNQDSSQDQFGGEPLTLDSVTAAAVSDNVKKCKRTKKCRGMNLRYANLKYADLDGADLRYADLRYDKLDFLYT